MTKRSLSPHNRRSDWLWKQRLALPKVSIGLRRLSVIAALLILLSSLTLPARAATINVGCNVNQLIAAILAARDHDEINLAAGCTYTLNQLYFSSFTGLPQISYIITIHGNGAIIQRSQAAGTPKFRPFYVSPNGNLTIENLTLRYGDSGNASGGSIYNYFGTVTVKNSTITNNKAPNGGGILNYNGTVTVIDSTISNNTAGDGGGIYSYLGTATVKNSTLSSNVATSATGAGGIFNLIATATVSNSTLTGNSAPNGRGGGIRNNGGTAGVNVGILYGDMMDIMNPRPLIYAAAISGSLTVSNSTLSGNSASVGGGISNNTGGVVALGSSIVAANTAPSSPDVNGAISSLGWNVIGNTAGAALTGTTTGNLVNGAASPLNLSALADNGGPTQTMAIGAGSVAIGAGNCLTLTGVAPLTTDQRGEAHKTPCDAGAFESEFLPDAIFSDGFEGGNLNAWSARVADGVDLAAVAAARLTGTRGMRALIDDTTAIYVQDDTPNSEARYRARFYFDPNSITMATNETMFLFFGYQGGSTVALRVQFRRTASSYQLRTGLLTDGGTTLYTSFTNISDAPHIVEIDWKASSAAGANDGGLALWVDEVPQTLQTGIDNDTVRIDRVRLGAVSGIQAGTSGTLYFDAFRSTRQSYIGAEVGGLSVLVEPDAEPTEPVTRETAPEAPVEVTPEAPTVTPEATVEPTLPSVEPTIEPPLLPFSVPVYQTMDDGAPLWTASAGWQLSADAAYSGLGWLAAASGNAETLALKVPVNLAGAVTPTLSFQSKLISGVLPEVRISLDGVNWQVVASVTPSLNWTLVTVDLSAYAGQTVLVQFAWATPAGASDTWQVDEVTIADGAVLPPTEPTEPAVEPTVTPDAPGNEPPVYIPTPAPREGGAAPDAPADLPSAPTG